MTKEEVIRSIEEAFANAVYPGDERTIASHQLGLDTSFVGRRWQDLIEIAFLSDHRVVSFFTEEGLAYYLPAYLIGSLKFSSDKSTWLNYVINALSAEEWMGENVERVAKLVEILSGEQRHSVKVFLEYLLHTEGEQWTIGRSRNILQETLDYGWKYF